MPKYNDVFIWESDLYMEIHRVLCAMAPYSTKMINGRWRWIPSKPRFGNVSNIIVILAVTLFGQYKSLAMSDLSDPVSFYATVIQAITVVLVMLITQIIYLFTHRHTLIVYNMMDKIDKELVKLDIFISYKFLVYLTYFGSCVLWLIAILCMVLSDRPPWKMFYDFIGFAYPLIARFVLLWFPITTLATLFERFYQLNKCLNRLDDDFESKEKNEHFKPSSNSLDPEFVLDTVTNLHARLVECNQLGMNTYGPVILVNIIYNLVHFIMGVYFSIWGNSICLTNVEMLGTTIGLTCQMGSIYMLGYFTQTEANDCLVTLGYLNILYSNNKLMTMKNTFLLQSLHLKINTDVCGLFPLNMSIFLMQMNFCNSFILLLIQYQKSYVN